MTTSEAIQRLDLVLANMSGNSEDHFVCKLCLSTLCHATNEPLPPNIQKFLSAFHKPIGLNGVCQDSPETVKRTSGPASSPIAEAYPSV